MHVVVIPQDGARGGRMGLAVELDLTGLSDGWKCPTPETVQGALEQAQLALRDDGDRPLTERLRVG